MHSFGNTCITTSCNLVIQVESNLPLPVIPIHFNIIENTSSRKNDHLQRLRINILLEHLVLVKILRKIKTTVLDTTHLKKSYISLQ